MAGFLDASYGVTDAKREHRVKVIVAATLCIALVGTILYFSFRNWKQEKIVKQFISLIKDKNYQEAYAAWGCTQEKPCKYYPPEKFNEDFGPTGQYKDIGNAAVEAEDVCGSGVVFSMKVPGADPVGLWVENGSTSLSFAPWARCPGRHMQLWEFLKSRFS